MVGSNGTVTASPKRIVADGVGRLKQFGARMDAFFNTVTGQGVLGKDHALQAGFERSRQITPREYNALYEESPLFARMVDEIPKDATRNWISIKGAADAGDDDDYGTLMLDAMKALKLKQKMRQALRAKRLDGGAALILGANDGLEPWEPLDLDRVQSLDYVNVVTRWEIQPADRDNNPASPTFREPLAYQFTGTAASTERVHHSRVIRMRGIVATECPLWQTLGDQFSNLYWGVPLAQQVWEILRGFTSAYSSVEGALKTLNEAVFGIKNLTQILAGEDGKANLTARLEFVRYCASQYNAVLYEPGDESYERRASVVTGLEGILAKEMELLAAASGMPVTKLFGLAPGGLSTDNESGNRNWNAIISDEQQDELVPALERIAAIMFHAKLGPTGGKVPERWSVSCLPLDEPDEAEDATTRKTEADTDQVLILNEVITSAEARSRLRNDPSCPYTLDTENDDAADAMGGLSGEPDADAKDTLAPAAGGVPGKAAANVQAEMANGAQVEAARTLLVSMGSGEISTATGRQMLVSFFRLSEAEADAMINGVIVRVTDTPTVPVST